MTRRAVFLDRDGVINRAVVRDGRPSSPGTLEELEILPGVRDALTMLREAGFQLVVVTNQPDAVRGRQTRRTFEAMHEILAAALPIHEFRVCYHDDGDRCACRKPSAGLLCDAVREAGLDLAASFMVGDRWKDIEAGRRAGCRTILVEGGHTEPCTSEPDVRVRSLLEAAAWILAQGRAVPMQGS